MNVGQHYSCCNDLSLMDLSKIELPNMEVQWTDVNLWVAMATILFNPIFWNIIARWEYRTRGFSKIIGSRRNACCLLAVSVFLLGVYRDMRFNAAINSQPRWYTLQQNWILWSGYLCMFTGTTLVLSSCYALGFYGTFLGDYFGILMDEKVTGFPFSVIDNPMYWGSSLNFFGIALIKASQSGIVLTVLVVIVYKIALMFEGPFTAHIYAERDRRKLV